jgi:hypothetical protein
MCLDHETCHFFHVLPFNRLPPVSPHNVGYLELQNPSTHDCSKNAGNIQFTRILSKENRLLLTNELVEIEKLPIEVQDIRFINDHFTRIFSYIPQVNEEKPKDVKHVTGCTWKH